MTEQSTNRNDCVEKGTLAIPHNLSEKPCLPKQEATIEQSEQDEGEPDGRSHQETQDRKANILHRLKLHGIKEVVVHYSGNGDDGGIYEIEITEPEEIGNLLEEAFHSAYESRGPDDLQQLALDIETLCLEELENRAGGWEIDEGSDGTFTFDVEAGTVSCSHCQYYRYCDSDTWEV